MKELSKEKMCKIRPLYTGRDDAVLMSCLERNLGKAWVDRIESPKTAMVAEKVGYEFFKEFIVYSV